MTRVAIDGALGTVPPELQGKIAALAIRAPVLDGSIVDLVGRLR